MFPQVNQMIVLALLKQLVLLQVRLHKTISESLSPIIGDPSGTFATNGLSTVVRHFVIKSIDNNFRYKQLQSSK